MRKPTGPKLQAKMSSPATGGFSLKYQCCLRGGDGKICCGYGPFLGSSQELDIFQQGGLHDLLEPGECVVASAEFPPHPGVITTNNFDALFDNKEAQDYSEAEVEASRQDLKNLCNAGQQTIEVLKSFKCLTEPWRYKPNQHGVMFMVCLQLTNHIVMSQKNIHDSGDEGEI